MTRTLASLSPAVIQSNILIMTEELELETESFIIVANATQREDCERTGSSRSELFWQLANHSTPNLHHHSTIPRLAFPQSLAASICGLGL
ncbi:hypothetical protein KQX54_004164 [Cotesia glomerata]|uniref:Uncharacterized protein n=1 Tax=Cotesia glomerata TaxID=32391 RepID=A0AAV7II73_COTGL|nr:hypothetical protein KQX54_004164 [Cotesia glomerata]